MTITIRTDASLQIGTGHVMRCLTLARALRGAGARCRFITRALPGDLAGRIEAEGFDVTVLPEPKGQAPARPPAHAHWAGVDWIQDAAETRAALDTNPPDWLVMDHYAFDARWQRAARPLSTKLMVIDDLADRPHDCDLLLDQNLGHDATDYAGLVPEDCTCLTGPQFALLRPEFAEARAAALSARSGRGLKNLLITMGGVDSVDATSAVLQALRTASLPDELRISVIMGSGAPALGRVQRLAQDMPWPTEVAVDVTDMATRMAHADLAIGAGGGTTWERCCLGLPSIIVETAGNQTGIAKAMAAAGAGRDSGPLNASTFTQNLKSILAEASDPVRLTEMSQRAAAICDGDGIGRVLNVLRPAEIRFRTAVRADSRRVWAWRRTADRTSRLEDKNTSYGEHDEWFCRAIHDPERTIRIAMQGDLPCGYLRLDRTEEARARVSVCLSPEVRGKGLGRRFLEEADQLGAHLCLEWLDAEIHKENDASRHVFMAAGYVLGNPVNDFLTCHRKLEKAI